MNLVMALLGAVLLAVGAGLVYVPAGVITAGVVLIVIAYVRSYFAARESE